MGTLGVLCANAWAASEGEQPARLCSLVGEKGTWGMSTGEGLDALVTSAWDIGVPPQCFGRIIVKLTPVLPATIPLFIQDTFEV